MAHRIAEHKDVQLPLMVCQDGFITSHSIENIELIEDEKVKEINEKVSLEPGEEKYLPKKCRDN